MVGLYAEYVLNSHIGADSIFGFTGKVFRFRMMSKESTGALTHDSVWAQGQSGSCSHEDIDRWMGEILDFVDYGEIRDPYGSFLVGAYSDFDSDLEEIFPQGRGRVEARRNKRELGRQFNGLPTGIVWEFGRQIDLKDENGVADYFHHLSQWFDGLKKPKSLNSCRVKVNTFLKSKVHRQLALVILAQQGVLMAKLFLAVKRGTLTEEKYDAFLINYEAEAQGYEGWVIPGLFAAAIVALWNRDKIQKGVKRVKNVYGGVEKLTEKLTGSLDSLTEIKTFVLGWIRDKYKQFKKMVIKIAGFAAPIIKTLLFLVAILVAMSVVGTIAKEIASKITDFLFLFFKLPMRMLPWFGVKAQGGKNFLPEFLKTVYEYTFERPGKVFIDLLGPLPKIVSIAKAIEWLFTKFGEVTSAMMESWTGELQGKTKLEEDILLFKDKVLEYKAEIVRGNIERLTSLDMSVISSELSMSKLQLDRKVINSRDLRPVMLSQYNIYSTELVKTKEQHDAILLQGKRRAVPVFLYLHSKPGLGKSTILEKLCNSVWTTMQKWQDKGDPIFKDAKFDMTQVYNFVQTDDYHDGYRSQPITQIDDLFQARDAEVMASTANQIISMCSPTPYAMLVATPEMKNHTFFTSKLILATSNMPPDLNSQNCGLHDVSALTGRFTIQAEMIDRDSFALSSCEYSGPCKGIRKGYNNEAILSFEHLVGLICECLLQRHKEKAVDPEVVVPARKNFGYSTKRLVIQDEESGEKEEEKEKEKEVDEIESQGKGDLPWFSRYAGKAQIREALAFNSMPHRLRNWFWRLDKHAFMPSSTGYIYEEWLELECTRVYVKTATLATCQSSYEEETFDYFVKERPVLAGSVIPTVEDYELMKHKQPILPKIMLAISVAAIAVVGVYKLVQLFLTESAYQKVEYQSKSYDSQYKGDKGKPGASKKQGTHRTNVQGKGKRGDAAASFWQRGGQGSQSVVRTMVAENSEVIEVRIGPGGCSWQDVKDNPPVQSSFALYVGGDWMLVPRHVLFSCATMGEDEIFVSCRRGVSHNFNMRECKDYVPLQGDIGLITVPGIRPRRNLLGHFADDLPQYGRMEHLVPHLTKTELVVETALSWENTMRMVPINEEYGEFETDLRLHGITNEAGMCGTVYVHQGTGKIVGIHMGGAPLCQTSFATIILKEDLAKHIKPVEIIAPLDPDFGTASVQSGVQVLGLVQPKLATFIPDQTKLVRTMFNIDTLPFKETRDIPALLRPTVIDGELKSPVDNYFQNKLGKQYRVPEPEPLQSFKGFLPNSFNPNNVKVITIEEAIFGIPGVLKAMDRTTSVGYFYKKLHLSRSDLFGPSPQDNGGKIQIHPILRRDVEIKMQTLREGKIPSGVIELFLKDELRAPEKVSQADTRAVDPMDLASLIVQRMVLGTFIEEGMKDPVFSPVALSINPHSSQWGAVYSRHRGRGKRMIGGGDFRYYDISIKNRIRDDFIRMVRENHPDPDLAERVILINFISWHICGKIAFLRPWGTSTGSLITGYFNCFANWWIHKSAFLTVEKEERWEEVFTTFVGDDSLFSTPESLKHFNMQVIQKFCEEKLAMVYTSPTKDDNMFVDWDTLTFLKRRFVMDHRGVMAPLAEGSLSNMVKWCETEPTNVEVMESTLNSLLLEAWHYGEEKFKQVEDWCRTETRRLGMHVTLPDWESLEQMRKKDYRIGMCMLSPRTIERYAAVSQLTRTVVALNQLSMRFFGFKFTCCCFAPIVEELARTISGTFSQEIVNIESGEFQEFIMEPMDPTVKAMIGQQAETLRGQANRFHDQLDCISKMQGWRSLFKRIDLHISWNSGILRNQERGIIAKPEIGLEWDDYGFCAVGVKTLNAPCELEDSRVLRSLVNRITLHLSKCLNCLPDAFDHGRSVFNVITETTATTSENGIQADSQQMLTKPVETSLMVTPTMMFGDIGTTVEQETGGYAERAHGVGEYEDKQLLERMVVLNTYSWTVGAAAGNIANFDVTSALYFYLRNKAIMLLYQFFRTDIEITVKLNTNQFYVGALMLTLFPATKSTGNTLAERAIMDPTVISASSAESVVKTWKWSWPYPWRGIWGQDADGSAQPHTVTLSIDNLFPLTVAQEGMPSVLSIQVWARFKNLKLMYPCNVAADSVLSAKEERRSIQRRIRAKRHVFGEKEKIEAQSRRGSMYPPKIATPRGSQVTHPSQDPGTSLANLGTSLIDAVTSIPATIVDGAVGTLTGVIDAGAGALLGAFLDKPDQVDEQGAIIIEQSKDLFCSDIPDTNVCLSLNKAKYVDPSPSRMPMSKNWTLLDYAKIPGLRLLYTFTNAGGSAGTVAFSLVQSTTFADQLRTPLEYACQCAYLKRGSVKLMLQFFTSAFISARFALQLARLDDDIEGFDADYAYGLTKVINVKGDTVDSITIPWLDSAWWSQISSRQIQISLISDIATTDTTSTPTIYMAAWIAAGDDFQFQFPIVPTHTGWSDGMSVEAQASIGKMFEAEFPPIADNQVYDMDNGFSSSETIGYMTDVAKRYSPFDQVNGNTNLQPTIFNVNILDSHPNAAATANYAQYVGQRATFFGAMRECFLFRSGGYRYRRYYAPEGATVWNVQQADGTNHISTTYIQPFDSTSRLTVPQVSTRPFIMFDDWSEAPGGMPQAGLSLNGQVQTSTSYIHYIAARDDVQFGYPILPSGVPLAFSGASKKEGVEAGRRALSQTRGKAFQEKRSD